MSRKSVRSRARSYDVGYGKPPKAGRFQPGRSGNPKGRPRESKNDKTLLQEELNAIVVVNEGGIPRRMSKRRAYYKMLVNRALKEPRYAALLMKTMEQYGLLKAEQAPTSMVIEFVRPKREDDDKDPGKT